MKHFIILRADIVVRVSTRVRLSAATDPEGGHDPVLGDGLKETRGSRQTLQPGAAGGEKGADHNHPGRRPCQGADHQVPVDPFAEP